MGLRIISDFLRVKQTPDILPYPGMGVQSLIYTMVKINYGQSLFLKKY
jgi:hypothetical protein